MTGDLVKHRFITHKVAGYRREDNNHKKLKAMLSCVTIYSSARIHADVQ